MHSSGASSRSGWPRPRESLSGAAPGDQIVKIAGKGYDTTAVDIGIPSTAGPTAPRAG